MIEQRRKVRGVCDEVALTLEQAAKLQLQVCVQLGLGNSF
jgi:hypothetical protein